MLLRNSVCFQDTKLLFVEGNQFFEAAGCGELFHALEGNLVCENLKKCSFTHKNAEIVRKFFPYSAPCKNKTKKISMGFGDRLGIAGCGHLRAIKGRDVFPIMAQQSMRELSLTKRGYEDVIDSSTWAVMISGYTGGFGADGDHLKRFEDIAYALKCGCTMITLDCSDHIHNAMLGLSNDALKEKYQAAGLSKNGRMERYLKKYVKLADVEFEISEEDIMRFELVYGDAIEFICEVWERFIKGNDIDFEISIDETNVSTDPLSHYMLGNELALSGVAISSMAPRFCGHFEKGIDYVGDIKQFEREFKIHEFICEKLGYKISVHSGSDKFGVFEIIGRCASSFHLKTAGTSWLEAVRTISKVEPELFRKIYAYAIEVYSQASEFYVITYGPKTMPEISAYRDDELITLMDRDDVRQTLHIAYGYILCDQDEKGNYKFREEVYSALNKNIETYDDMLERHFNRHMDLLIILT